MWGSLRMLEHFEFEFGKFDCVRLSATIIDSIVVDSHMMKLVSSLYADKRSALRLLMRSGGLDTLVTRYLGSPGPRAWARAGDVVAVELESGPAVGICTGPTIAVAATPVGIAYLPMERGMQSWKVD
jgi:hypothetical protein